MNYSFARGIAPGKIIAREIKKRNISQRALAKSINVHSQTLNSIVKNRRKLTLELSLKLERELELPEGTLLMLQVYYLIEEYKNRSENFNKEYKNPPKLRKILFWDTDFSKIDWIKQKEAILKRVKTKGTEEEKKEIASFYNLPINEIL